MVLNTRTTGVTLEDYVFTDKTSEPDEPMLAEKIGKAFKYLLELREYVRNNYSDITEEWKYYGVKYGWQLKTFFKKRNLFFIIPLVNLFRIVFIFGDTAVSEIQKSDISLKIKTDIVKAKKYTEGRGISLEIFDDKYMSDIKKLIEIKIKN